MFTNVKIDLHLHSLASRRNGDGIQWESWYAAIRQLKQHGVQIAAFSDHNVFDAKQYYQAQLLAQSAQILLLPAIEVDVVRTDGTRANLIFVFSDELSPAQLDQISQRTRGLFKRGISLADVSAIFGEFECLKIPHVGKSDHFKWHDLQQIHYDAIEISNPHHPNYKAVLKRRLCSSVVAFSDTHIWRRYPQQGKLVTVIDQMATISFAALKMALAQNRDFTKRRLNFV